MNKKILAALLCIMVLTAGCGTAPAPSAESGQAAKEEKTAEESVSTAGTDDAGKAEQAPAQEADTAKASAKAAPAEAEGAAAAETVSAQTASAETEEAAEAQTAPAKTKEAATDEAASAAAAKADEDKAKEEKAEALRKKAAEAKEKAEKAAEEKRQAEAEALAGDYIPEGFSPYGEYTLVFDSGYTVKSRYSKAGLTFYMESEEFFFIQDKNLPDMTGNVAHILFNNQAPMTEAEAAGEEFPFAENYVLYISLDDGSYYEVYSSQLDLTGRKFARDLFESFRVKWEGAF